MTPPGYNATASAETLAAERNSLTIRLRRNWWKLIATLIIGLFSISTFLGHMDFVPIWDAWGFVNQCFRGFAYHGTISCFSHTAQVPTAIYGCILTIHDDIRMLYAANFIFLLICLFTLDRILRQLQRHHSGLFERAIFGAIFCLCPLIFSQVFVISLDFLLSILTLVNLWFLLERRYIPVGLFFGPMLVFTKDTGIGIYVALVYPSVLCAAAFNKRCLTIASLLALTLPPVLFVAYCLLFPIHASEYGQSVSEVLSQFTHLGFSTPIQRGQLACTFVLNFNWILTLGIMVAVGKALIAGSGLGFNLKESPSLQNSVISVLCLFSTVFILTRYVPFNNPRYTSACFGLLTVTFFGAVNWLFPTRLIRELIGLGALCFLCLSCYRTIDPLSRFVFGTFTFDQRELLALGRENSSDGHHPGRDELAYNFELLDVCKSLDAVFRRFGPLAVYRMPTYASFFNFEDFRGFDFNKHGRSDRPTCGPPLNIRDALNDTKLSTLTTFQFVDWPNFSADPDFHRIESLFFRESTEKSGILGLRFSVITFRNRAALGLKK